MGVGVKICGLRRRGDAALALELGAFAIGFVFEPSSPRYVGSPDWAPEWLNELGGWRVAVYGKAPEFRTARGFDAVQIVDGPNPRSDGNLEEIRVVRVRSGVAPDAIAANSAGAPTVLLDAYDPSAYGGTGQTVDWELARRVAELLRRIGTYRVGLAGGLKPENVAEAIRRVEPDYVDVSGGVESAPGVKDEERMRRFFEAVRQA